MTGVPSDLDLGALLAEQEFVRRLVRGLVWHEADADDVAQETFARALQQPVRGSRGARPFLTVVARRVASNLRRAHLRRRRREAAAAVPEQTAAVADVFARESMRQLVVAELAALPEPYRRTLVLRYFEDLPPRAIARRDGVPEGTVRSRLKRGLDQLRMRLDDRFGGDRSAWCAAVLPLARAAQPTTAGWVLLSSFGIGHLLLLGAAMLVAGALFLFFRHDPAPAPHLVQVADRAEPAAIEVRDETLAAPAPAANGRAPIERTEPRPAAAEARPGNGIRGRVVLPGGEPAPGRKVELCGLDPARLFEGGNGELAASAPFLVTETISDQEGRFAFTDVPVRGLFTLRAGRGRDHAAWVPVPHTPGPQQVVDLGDIELTARGRLVGRVEDEDGEPVAGAEVWAADVPGIIALAVNLDRFAPEHGAIFLLPRARPGEPAREFAARVRRWLGSELFLKPQTIDDACDAFVLDVPEWFARLHAALPIARTTTGTDGAFVLDDVEPGSNMLVVRKAGYAGVTDAKVKVAAGTRDLGTITLDRGETCTGVVLDARGRPVAGAAVRVAMLPLAGFRGLAFCDAELRTDAAGRFAAPGLRRGQVLVAAQARADEPWVVRGPFSSGSDVRLELPAPATLRVRVTLPTAGEPHVAVRFGPVTGELARMGVRRELPLAGRIERTAEGFTIGDLVPGSYEVEVRVPGCVPARCRATAPGDIDVVLEPAAPPLDVLVVSRGKTPVAGARVRCTLPGDDALGVLPADFGLPVPTVLSTSLGCTDADGRLRVEGLPRGTLTFWADHPAFGVGVQRVELPAEAVVLELPEAATLEGVLLDGGRPADPAKWRIVVEPGARDDGIARPYALASPGPDGSFRVTGLDAGVHTVEAKPALQPRLNLSVLQELIADRIFSFLLSATGPAREVVLRPGAVRTLRIDVQRTDERAPAQARLVGRVLCDGEPAAGVRIAPAMLPDRALATTTRDGTYAVDGLREGAHDVAFVGADGNVLAVHTVVVPEDGEVACDLALTTAPLRGKVVPPPGRTLAGAKVHGRGPDHASLVLPVGADGSFAMAHVPCGTWALRVVGPGVLSPEETVCAVQRGVPASVELAPAPAFILTVVVENMPARGHAWVQAQNHGARVGFMLRTDDAGRVQFKGVPGGEYHLSCEETGASGTYTLEGGAEHEVRLTPQGVMRVDGSGR